ncbi:hypothetical protein Rcae01_06004 [Novipirellula caenicola]|uniref:Secreted protein n=1 Tax=Novipirellula caenicola TaxID=1536901 RepID=A0ABP9VZE1_9BACT
MKHVSWSGIFFGTFSGLCGYRGRFIAAKGSRSNLFRVDKKSMVNVYFEVRSNMPRTVSSAMRLGSHDCAWNRLDAKTSCSEAFFL